MNAPRSASQLATYLMILFLPCGCDHRRAETSAGPGDEKAAVQESVGITYKSNSGLHIHPDTAEFIGLSLADVEERQLGAQFRFTAQVYRPEVEPSSQAADGLALRVFASGLVDPAQAGRLVNGQSVLLEKDGKPVGRGRLTKPDASLAGGLESSELLVSVEDGAHTLKDGTFVSVVVPMGRKGRVASIPSQALLRSVEGDFVYTASGDSYVRAAVKVGTTNDDFVEIAEGLYPGDRIVVSPVMTLWMAELQSIRGGKACADGH